jgi:hypothetical protein
MLKCPGMNFCWGKKKMNESEGTTSYQVVLRKEKEGGRAVVSVWVGAYQSIRHDSRTKRKSIGTFLFSRGAILLMYKKASTK